MSPSGLLSLTTLEVQSLLISLASQSSKRYNWQVCRYSGKGLVRFITPEIPNTGGQSSFSITPRFITPWMLHFEVSSWFRFWLFNPTSRDHKASPVYSDASGSSWALLPRSDPMKTHGGWSGQIRLVVPQVLAQLIISSTDATITCLAPLSRAL